jgi:hypothetical protein
MSVCLDSWAILGWLDGEKPSLTRLNTLIDAARLKACAALALADCLAATTAAAHGLVLLTGDPDLLDLNDPPCRLEDLRANQTPQH